MRNAIKIPKSNRQFYEYNLLINNLNKYKNELKRIEDRFYDDKRNIYLKNKSAHYNKKISRIETLLSH